MRERKLTCANRCPNVQPELKFPTALLCERQPHRAEKGSKAQPRSDILHAALTPRVFGHPCLLRDHRPEDGKRPIPFQVGPRAACWGAKHGLVTGPPDVIEVILRLVELQGRGITHDAVTKLVIHKSPDGKYLSRVAAPRSGSDLGSARIIAACRVSFQASDAAPA